MDSLTQIALGATVAEAVIGRKVGNRAIMWGAICGTLPDLDVFVPMGGAVENFTYHRSYSHSVIVLAALTPLIVWLITKVHPATRPMWRGWTLAVFLALATHPILDCFTVYGTQILWPIWPEPVSWSAIFIIDPFYTLPLATGALCALFMSRQIGVGHRMALTGLALSSVYMAWAVTAKSIIAVRLQTALVAQGLEKNLVLTTPAPFTTLLWRTVVMDGDRYHEGYMSLFDEEPGIKLNAYPTQPDLLMDIQSHWPVERLKWFTHGFYSVRTASPQIVMSDLRMGVEGSYIFSFQVGRVNDGVSIPVPNKRVPQPQNLSRLGAVWQRIWDQEVSLAPQQIDQ